MNEQLDLTNFDDLQEFHEMVKELRENSFLRLLFDLSGEDFDSLDQYADEVYESAHKNDKKESDFPRPSEKLTTEQGLQIHKITQEYIDTMIKPYNNNVLTDQQINDAYAGLYEFAAWIYTK